MRDEGVVAQVCVVGMQVWVVGVMMARLPGPVIVAWGGVASCFGLSSAL